MKKIIILFAILSSLGSKAQESGGELCSKNKITSFSRNRANARVAALGDPTTDVTFHKISLDIDYDKKYIKGNVKTIFKAKADISECTFDLNNALKVDSVVENNKKFVFSHTSNRLKITLPLKLKIGEAQTMTIYYQGSPATTGFGSFSFDVHGTAKSPIVSSLSESYGAPSWWPCKDDLTDKIDSSEVSITLPSSYVSVSNGLLKDVKTNAANGTKTYNWKSSYPIAHYLISIACSNYVSYNLKFVYNGKTMPVDNYIYPEVESANVKAQLDATLDMLKFFSDTFGEYPFIKEKYGHAMFKFGGGMEHQTVSSMVGFGESLVSHELAHQWFGDNITCKTWSDIFVNEAFASYSEALYNEYKYGIARYNTTINGHITSAKKVTEKIYIARPEDENLIFNYALTYSKGAVVIHMLRGVMGDKKFFETLKAYQSSNLKYGPATVEDFRKVAETTSNTDLKYFFDEWIYGVSYPKYQFSWVNAANNAVVVDINQTKLNTVPEIFKMPVQLKLVYDNGKDTLVSVIVDKLTNNFKIDKLKTPVKSIVFDPNGYIMKDLTEVAGILTGTEPTNAKTIVYPNPSDGKFDINSFNKKLIKTELFDNNGRLVKTQTKDFEVEKTTIKNQGRYILKMYFEDGSFETKKLVVE
jgi:aminopeptidase N